MSTATTTAAVATAAAAPTTTPAAAAVMTMIPCTTCETPIHMESYGFDSNGDLVAIEVCSRYCKGNCKSCHVEYSAQEILACSTGQEELEKRFGDKAYKRSDWPCVCTQALRKARVEYAYRFTDSRTARAKQKKEERKNGVAFRKNYMFQMTKGMTGDRLKRATDMINEDFMAEDRRRARLALDEDESNDDSEDEEFDVYACLACCAIGPEQETKEVVAAFQFYMNRIGHSYNDAIQFWRRRGKALTGTEDCVDDTNLNNIIQNASDDVKDMIDISGDDDDDDTDDDEADNDDEANDNDDEANDNDDDDDDEEEPKENKEDASDSNSSISGDSNVPEEPAPAPVPMPAVIHGEAPKPKRQRTLTPIQVAKKEARDAKKKAAKDLKAANAKLKAAEKMEKEAKAAAAKGSPPKKRGAKKTKKN